MDNRGREYAGDIPAPEPMPCVTQVIAQLIVEAVGQMPVLFEFRPSLGICDFLLALGLVVFKLVYEVLGQFAASDIYEQFPAVTRAFSTVQWSALDIPQWNNSTACYSAQKGFQRLQEYPSA